MTSANIAIEASSLLTSAIERDWATERRLAQTNLDELRQQRGAALLDGGTFDHKQIMDAEAVLDAIHAAEIEETRRIRSQQTKDAARLRRDTMHRLKGVLEQRAVTLRHAEKSARSLAKSLSELLQLSEEAQGLIRSLGLNAWQLQAHMVINRASYRVAHILGSVAGHHFGEITMPPATGPALADGTSARDSWVDSDKKLIAAEIAAVLSMENGE